MRGRRLRARQRFPRGLLQPPGSYRFSLEALLLACWLPLRPGLLGLDLGAGCGVVGLGLLCRQESMRVHGLDVQPHLVRAARYNARRLGFGRRFAVFCADVAEPDLFGASAKDGAEAGTPGRACAKDAAGSALPFRAASEKAALRAGAYDLVLANPPYRQRDAGRLPLSPSRQTALFAHAHTLDAFCGAAATALKPGGRLGMIYPYERKEELFAALARAGLRSVRLLPLLPRAGKPASLLLLEAEKPPCSVPEEQAGVAPPESEAPLELHAGTGFSAAAVAFCPFLRPAGSAPRPGSVGKRGSAG